MRFAFPPRYRYDVLRALDYVRDAGMPLDTRLVEALAAVETSRMPDGCRALDDCRDEALAFPFDETAGEPSEWNTLRALRVLRAYDQTVLTV